MRTLFTPLQLNSLVQHYSEPFRVYHNLEHITVLFQLASAHGVRLTTAQQIAIWYHDAIYFASNSIENELRSAELMKDTLSQNSWISESTIDRAYNIILATKGHQSDDHETQTVLDLDLAGLGFDFDTYLFASHKVRAEFNHLSEEQWIKGRQVFLKSMLARDHIYYTPWGRDYYEKSARRNIEAELKMLTA
jgi:predicted metal-dependent HD superfamily phosphohydrolase